MKTVIELKKGIKMKYFSKEGQDRFAHILIGNKGKFLDLGCNHPYAGNNTAALEQLGWSGIVVDYQPAGCP